MRKDLFIKCMNHFKEYTDWEHKLYELGINFWERDEIANLLGSYLELLQYCCKDEPDKTYPYSPTNIEYFIYDEEFGSKADEYFITESDGTEVKIRTPEDLWNYLVKNNPDIEDEGLVRENYSK